VNLTKANVSLSPISWASHHIEKLQRGEEVSFRPRGHSMSGKIESGQLCTVIPVDVASLKVGDVVLCKVRGRDNALDLVSGL
jgi:hypothetical protein